MKIILYYIRMECRLGFFNFIGTLFPIGLHYINIFINKNLPSSIEREANIIKIHTQAHSNRLVIIS